MSFLNKGKQEEIRKQSAGFRNQGDQIAMPERKLALGNDAPRLVRIRIVSLQTLIQS